jgi:hypothetical protein
MCTAAIARMRKEKESPWVRIGTAPDVEFPIEQAPAPSFPMVSPMGDDFAFSFGHGMEGEMVVNGQTTSLAELAAQGRTDDQSDSVGREDPRARRQDHVPRVERAASAPQAMPLFARSRAACSRTSRARSRSTWASGCSCSRFPSRTAARTSTSRRSKTRR